ncbi:SDR family NAD(P)-dependent oxidoreductase [Thermoactinomyces mirandus]|uniref:SDR family NAD(P)-dependent oxidoreductase n=1 Tax=Thermoactinomyces mirandus TaxID=2756294 RepID=A0A7W1XSP4_9BACL|nr:SDR family NAD(P)-dependent oxidoreductase [Thermoactinomyces mirandus]MBA4602365.1 SDR family NAD(P)-dependent oxidoreductase [Thermoactinomyces mirandus]
MLITGAAKGIGKGIALSAAKEGANIALHYYRSKQAAKATANLLNDYGVEAVLTKGDLAGWKM